MKRIVLIVLLGYIVLLCSACASAPSSEGEESKNTIIEADEDYEYHYNVTDETNRYVIPGQPAKGKTNAKDTAKPEKITYKEFSVGIDELIGTYVEPLLGDIKYSVYIEGVDEKALFNSAEYYLSDPSNYPTIFILADVSNPFYYASEIQTALVENGLYATVYITKER
jgi:hypothetical protein